MKKIGITVGDPSGIGAEIILKSVHTLRRIPGCQFIIFAPAGLLDQYAHLLHSAIILPVTKSTQSMSKKIAVLNVVEPIPFQVGKPSALTGDIAYRIVEKAIHFAIEGEIDALVTAPICKSAINLTGRKFTGHTEMLKRMTGVKEILMFFVSKKLKAGIVTTHLSIRAVPQKITRTCIVSKLQILCRELQQFFRIMKPVIGVSALNPHGGEDGFLGKEEITIIRPAIESAQKLGIRAEGPFPADTIFLKSNSFDALLFMFHDQAMIPVKLLSWGCNVNVTLGLPFVRTSPDHGTGFDIAGKGIASPDSFIEAVRLACRMVKYPERKKRGKD